jgi:hypothetical protein
MRYIIELMKVLLYYTYQVLQKKRWCHGIAPHVGTIRLIGTRTTFWETDPDKIRDAVPLPGLIAHDNREILILSINGVLP